MQGELAAHFQSRSRCLWLCCLVMATLACFGLFQNWNATASEPNTHPGYLVLVDGVEVAGGTDAAELNQIADELLDSYRTEHTTSAEFINRVEVVPGEVSEALPQKEAAAPAVADAVKVRVEEVFNNYTETEAETVYLQDDTLYEGDYQTEEGHTGEELTTQHVVSINGETRLVKTSGTVTITEAKPTVIRMGTKTRPEYMWPAHGSVSSYFGNDNGRTHKGIDITGGTGSNIYASRAGKVIFAGWNDGGFGNLVVIAHDNGTQTYYAHNSSILVHTGESVAQGQHIAEMGTTGRSSGVHCHFEVRVGGGNEPFAGTPVNPMSYIGK